MRLSVLVLTHNEERHIRHCLASARPFADELLVLDSGSTDRTVALARKGGARVEVRRFENFPFQRNAAIEMASGDWILFVDADERVTPAGGREIRSSIERYPSLAGFWVPRRNIIFGKEIRYAGWSPDYQPRVLHKGRARFDPAREVHELVLWDGETMRLTEPLIHYNYETLDQFHGKQLKYTRYEAQIWYNQGRRARLRGFVGQPVREFFRRYVALEGWRDGGHGLVLSMLMAYYAFVRQQLLVQIERQDRAARSPSN
jgi:glycosyltransferase involved in cell wall biosynthesis